MRRILCLLFCLTVLCGCAVPGRTVNVCIPIHPWETVSRTSMWYQVSVVSPSSAVWYYAGPGERELGVPVPRGQSVLILAYPMGKYAPFGGYIDPSVEGNTVLLSREEGILGAALLSESPEFLADLDFGYLLEKTRDKVSAMRFLDTQRLVEDYVCRSITAESLKSAGPVLIKDVQLPEGVYYSEFSEDGYFECIGDSTDFYIACGETSFYNFKLNIAVRFFVSLSGEYSLTAGEGLL